MKIKQTPLSKGVKNAWRHSSALLNAFVSVTDISLPYLFFQINRSMTRTKSERPVHLCTGRSLTESDDTRCCINTIWPPDDEHDFVRNM